MCRNLTPQQPYGGAISDHKKYVALTTTTRQGEEREIWKTEEKWHKISRTNFDHDKRVSGGRTLTEISWIYNVKHESIYANR